MTENTSDKVAKFFADLPVRELDKRQLLLSPGDKLTEVFYLVEGRVSEYDVTPSGNEVVVNVFKPGAFFPMSVALNGTPNDYFYEASTKAKAHVARPQDVLKFLEDNPDITLDLLKRVYRGVDGVLHRMAYLMGGDTQARLVFELLNAAYRFGEVQPDGSIFLNLKEGDVARHSGLARETVSRNLQGFKKAGLLDVSRLGITIRDVKRLEAILDA
jgi:CRP-like cAMP-binding protein